MILEKKYNPKNKNVEFISIYSKANDVPTLPSHDSIFSALSSKSPFRLQEEFTYTIKRGLLEFGNSAKNVWRLSDKESDEWLEIIDKNSYSTFGKIGKVRVGVKTTADKIFIRDDWDALKGEKPEDEILRPLINHKVASQYKQKESDNQIKILYTLIFLKTVNVSPWN